MTADNFTTVFETLRARKPFQVFTVELNGGDRYEIDHPGACFSRDGVAVFLAPGGVPHWFDHDSVLRVFVAGAEAETKG